MLICRKRMLCSKFESTSTTFVTGKSSITGGVVKVTNIFLEFGNNNNMSRTAERKLTADRTEIPSTLEHYMPASRGAHLQNLRPLSVADPEGRAGSPSPLWATDRRRHGTPDKWKRYCIVASAKFWSFYCKTCTSEYSNWGEGKGEGREARAAEGKKPPSTQIPEFAWGISRSHTGWPKNGTPYLYAYHVLVKCCLSVCPCIGC